jgi:uncharacterized protein YutE (UPF0331/DUF86 family)
LNKFLIILKKYLKEGEKHSMRLNRAYSNMESFMPLTGESIQSLTEDQIEHIDQYLYRFGKLQDVIGEKLFPTLLNFLGEDISKSSFIDIFNKLEKLEIIQDYDKWVKLRLIRNELAHEYEDEPDSNAERLNQIFNLKNDLERYLNDIKKYLKRFEEFS